MDDRTQDALATFVVASGGNDEASTDLGLRHIDQFVYECAVAGDDPLVGLRTLEAAFAEMKLDSTTGMAIQSSLRQMIGMMAITANFKLHEGQAPGLLTFNRLS